MMQILHLHLISENGNVDISDAFPLPQKTYSSVNNGHGSFCRRPCLDIE